MSAGWWASYGGLLLLAAGYVYFLYARREVRVPGRGLLAGLRLAALAVALLLLLDPVLPAGAGGVGSAGRWILVDRSLSMGAGDPDAAGDDEGAPWRRALERARADGGARGRVVFFGDAVRPDTDPSRSDLPGDLRSLLAPALERAAESGAREALVLSDLRVEDPAAARAVARRTGLRVIPRDLGVPVPGAAVAEFRLPRGVETGAPVPADVVVTVTSPVDSLTLEIREEDRRVALRRVAAPEPGRLARLQLRLPPPSAEGGAVRYTARVRATRDAFPEDDERVAYTEVDPEEGHLVLVSSSPDWEPRFLLPVLGRVTGLSTRGYLRVGPDRFLVMDAVGAGGTVGADVVRRQVEGAELLVAHGVDGRTLPWLARAVEAARRVVLLPADREGAGILGADTEAAATGEWYVEDELPASPVAGELAGTDLSSLPPLEGVLSLVDDSGWQVPLRARRDGTGRGEPVLVLGTGPGGSRRAVVLATRLWRWDFRGDRSRDAYRRLWAGIAGWLLADPTTAAPGIRAVARVVARGAPVGWSAPGLAGGTLRLRLERGDSAVADTTVAVSPSGRAELGPLLPGTYRWRASSETGGGGEAGGEGRVDVEAFSPELLHPRVTDLAVDPVPGDRPGTGSETGRPLRTRPLPWLLVAGLLCAEWILRRRRGLR